MKKQPNLLKLEDALNITHNSSGIFLLKDCNGSYLAVSKLLANFLGFKYPEELIHQTDADITICRGLADEFLTHDKIALSGTTWAGLEKTNWEGLGEIINFSVKTPVYDDSNCIVGVFCAGFFINDKSLHQKISEINVGKSKKINKFTVNGFSPSKEVKITEKEAECLFYLLRGKSASEIAQTLCRSKRTIEEHMQNLKWKFHCNTKAQLIESAINWGFLDYIPASFLREI